MSKGYVYFVGAPGRIKIGFTTKPEQRLIQLQAQDMERLTTIAIIDGSRKLERKLHLLASEYNFRREWFNDCPEVRAIMDKAIAGEITADADTGRSSEISMLLCEEYFEVKRLPLLVARATATRLYREFLEELLTLVKEREAAGEPFDRLLDIMRKVDPDVIAEKYRHLGQPIVAPDPKYQSLYS